jgi:type IV secretion system protein VirD4
MARLRPPPQVPRMDMDLHQAKVQQRWRFADDDLALGEGLNLEALAHDIALLPDAFDGPPPRMADVLLDFFGQGQSGQGAGGAIEHAVAADDVVIDLDRASAAPQEQASAS